MKFIKKHAGFLLVGIVLLVHLFIINDYGFTWDFHFHFFGGGKLLGYSWQQLESRALPYVEPDPRNAWSLPYGPLMSIPPVASYLFFYQTLHALPADDAYHLPIILWGVAGIGILYFFSKEAINARVALVAALFLGLTPRYFGDMHNNMKDIPSAVVFALNMWLIWRLVRHKRLSDLLVAIVGFAIAFNVKINSMFIPVVFGVWLLFLRFTTFDLRITKKVLSYFILAPAAAFLLWSTFWPHPLAQLDHAYRTFGIGTNNIEVLLNGHWYCSGSTVPWYYPFWYLAITTPLPILILFAVGLLSSLVALLKKADQKTFAGSTKILLMLWFMLPLTRYLLPKIGVIDGIRHFEEVVFPIATIAAIGFDFVVTFTKRKAFRIIFSTIVIALLIVPIVYYHPFQIAYFNELVGGAKGAFGKYDLDYWGSSQKKAVEWVNTHAPQNAKVHIVMSADVAGTYLRPDLLVNLNKYGYDDSDFVIFLNRQSFFYRFFYSYEYLLAHNPTYTVSAAGAPLTWVFDNRTNNKTPRKTPWWTSEDPCIIKYWKP